MRTFPPLQDTQEEKGPVDEVDELPSAFPNLKPWVSKLSCTTLRVVIPTTRSVAQVRL